MRTSAQAHQQKTFQLDDAWQMQRYAHKFQRPNILLPLTESSPTLKAIITSEWN